MDNQINAQKLFLKMIKINSESGDEDKFAEFCINYLKNLKFKVSTDKFGNIIAYNYRTKKQAPLLLCAHLDTVRPGKNIQPVLSKSVIKSRGDTILGADNKLAIALYFSAIESLIKQNKKIRPIEIVLTRQEERGMVGAKNLDYSKIKAKEGISLDAEGPVYSFISSSPYAEIFNIEITGKASHASIPEKGIDALKIFSDAYSKLKTGRIDSRTTINFGLINGGSGNNTVVEKVNVEGNFRAHSRKDLYNIKKKISSVFNKSANQYGGKSSIEYTKVIDGYKVTKSNSIIKSIEKSTGKKLTGKITNSGSDANIFHDRGIAIVELCHGIKYTHTTNERVSIKSIKQLSEIVEILLICDKTELPEIT